MHPAWEIHDICILLLEYLDNTDLARLARTCDYLHDLAVSELERRPDSLYPFIDCLPEDFKYKPLTASDLELFDRQSALVQHMTFNHSASHLFTRTRAFADAPRNFKYPKRPSGKLLKEKAEEENRTKLAAQLRLERKQRKAEKKSNPRPERKGKNWKVFWAEVANVRPQTNFMPNLQTLDFRGHWRSNLLLPFVGISGTNLTALTIGTTGETTEKLLEALADVPRLSYLEISHGHNFVPTALIEKAPLRSLSFNPCDSWHREPKFDVCSYSKPCRQVILEKAALRRAHLCLTQHWACTVDLNWSNRKFLPSLETLWLDVQLSEGPLCECSGKRGRFGWSKCQNRGSYGVIHDWLPCIEKSPMELLKRLDRPNLKILKIGFKNWRTGSMLLDVLACMKRSCRLENLRELVLVTYYHASYCYNQPRLQRIVALKTMRILLPLPQLRTLDLEMDTNFLEVFDLDVYSVIIAGLPNLEFLGTKQQEASHGHEVENAVPLHHIAAFCSMSSSLRRLRLGSVSGDDLESGPQAGWISPHITDLTISIIRPSTFDNGSRAWKDNVLHHLRYYFPGCARLQAHHTWVEHCLHIRWEMVPKGDWDRL